jgi:hypothetical protein
MITAYLNYPNSRIAIHYNNSCGAIRKTNKKHQRHVQICVNNIGIELERFNKSYKFGSTNEKNDMWVVVDFSDNRFELEVISYIKIILGTRYKPFRDASLKVHCNIA